MIIWFFFLFFLFWLLGLYNVISTKHKIYVYIIITILIVYFSAFRDGLGMDYVAYKEQCERIRPLPDEYILLFEPLFVKFTNYICISPFSYVFFFLITSIIINTSCLFVYYRTTNFSLATFFFVCFPGLFIMSFNTLRQFIVASIFLLISYIWYYKYNSKDTSKIRILLLILLLITFFIHKSAIILIPILFVGKWKIRPLIAILILLITYIIPFSSIPFIGVGMKIIEALNYDFYMDYDNTVVSKFSLTNIYLNIITIIILYKLYYKQNVISNIRNASYLSLFYNFSYIMIFFCMVTYNLCANGFVILYRLAIYFIVFLPVLIGLLPKLIYKPFAYCLVILPTLILLSVRFITGNEYLIPKHILPFLSIFK
ncbi:MAG: EpsG family protein [Bacteroides sp.]|nr:EpsG family protein [Bacteroides sp.]